MVDGIPQDKTNWHAARICSVYIVVLASGAFLVARVVDVVRASSWWGMDCKNTHDNVHVWAWVMASPSYDVSCLGCYHAKSQLAFLCSNVVWVVVPFVVVVRA